MKRLKYTPYNFNTKYEYRTHKYAGRDYGNFKTANKGIIGNSVRFIRKLWNRGQKRYKVCNTYSEWEIHVKSVIREDITNYEDFLHWLYVMKRDSEKDLQIVTVVQIPIYIVIFSIFVSVFGMEHLSIGSAIIILWITGNCVTYLLNALNHVYFYDDIIEICQAEFRSSKDK